MAHRPVHDPYGGVNPLIDKMIGNAFDIVKYVARYLKEVRYVAENMETVYNAVNLSRKYSVLATGTGDDTLIVFIDDSIVLDDIENIAVIATTVDNVRVFPAADTFSYVLNNDSSVLINIIDANLVSVQYKITVTCAPVIG